MTDEKKEELEKSLKKLDKYLRALKGHLDKLDLVHKEDRDLKRKQFNRNINLIRFNMFECEPNVATSMLCLELLRTSAEMSKYFEDTIGSIKLLRVINKVEEIIESINFLVGCKSFESFFDKDD